MQELAGMRVKSSLSVATMQQSWPGGNHFGDDRRHPTKKAGRASPAPSSAIASEISGRRAPNSPRYNSHHSRSQATPVAPQPKRVPPKPSLGGIERMQSSGDAFGLGA